MNTNKKIFLGFTLRVLLCALCAFARLFCRSILTENDWGVKEKDSRQDAKSAKEERKDERIGHGDWQTARSQGRLRSHVWFYSC
jgi:hypothetical protein